MSRYSATARRCFVGRWVGTVLLGVMAVLAAVTGLAHAAADAKPVITIQTSLGDIKAELDPKNAPKTTANFLAYVHSGYYEGTTFHRVIENFMIQGGGMTVELEAKPGLKPPIENEAKTGDGNQRGTLAMARRSDPASATSQFFINVVDNPSLDRRDDTPRGAGYAVFGRVIEGMEVVDRIRAVPTGTRGTYQNVPVEPVVIEGIREQP